MRKRLLSKTKYKIYEMDEEYMHKWFVTDFNLIKTENGNLS